MKYNKTLFWIFTILFIAAAAFTAIRICGVAQAQVAVQDSTTVIVVEDVAKFFPPWLITIVSFILASVGSTYLGTWVTTKLKIINPKVKFLITWAIIIAFGVLAAILAGKDLSNYTEFISYVVNASTAAYVWWVKKRK